MTRDWDVIVVGAGPAGSAAAYWTARGGGNVALLERASFPRDKACGDILSQAAVRELRAMELGPWLETRAPVHAWSGQFRTPGGDTIERAIRTRGESGPRWMTVPRVEFDAKLASHAQQAGAKLFEEVSVSDIVAKDSRVTVRGTGLTAGEMHAAMVVVASGSSSRFTLGSPHLVALRAYFSGSDEFDMRMDLDRRVLPGYAWQFPLPSGQFNIGYGSTRAQAKRIRLDQMLHSSELIRGKQRVSQIRGGMINTSFGSDKLHQPGVLYAGDAAGLVQPHLAEGIYPALRSGRLAAEHALTALADGGPQVAEFSAYTSSLHEAFAAEMRFSRALHWLLSQPRLVEGLASFILAYHRRLRSTLTGHDRHQISSR